MLGGISTAFVTSLFGITAAILYRILFKIFKGNLESKVSVLTERIEEMYPRKAAEQWLAENNKESVEQTTAIKNLSQDMAETLSELLNAQLPIVLTNFVKTIGRTRHCRNN